MKLKMWKSVPSDACLPERMWNTASRCSAVERSSMTAWTVPLPSCSGPGKSTTRKKLRPSRLVLPKWPLSMRMPTRPWQLPCVGRALKSHGQPKAQLQFFIQSPLRRHSVCGMSSFPFGTSNSLGAFNRQAGHLPFRKAILEPPYLIAPAPQQRDRLEGKDAPGTAAVSDNLAVLRQLRQPELQLRQRNIERAGQVAAGEFVLGAHVEQGYHPGT